MLWHIIVSKYVYIYIYIYIVYYICIITHVSEGRLPGPVPAPGTRATENAESRELEGSPCSGKVHPNTKTELDWVKTPETRFLLCGLGTVEDYHALSQLALWLILPNVVRLYEPKSLHTYVHDPWLASRINDALRRWQGPEQHGGCWVSDSEDVKNDTLACQY